MAGNASTTLSDSVLVETSPQAAYEAISDVRRMGEWSPEATGAEVSTPGPVGLGSTFRGKNRRGRVNWTTTCTVVAAEPGERFAFEVRVLCRPIARWSYEFSEEADGVRVTETWTDKRFGVVGALARAVGAVVTKASSDGSGATDRVEINRQGIRETLTRLKRHLEESTNRA